MKIHLSETEFLKAELKREKALAAQPAPVQEPFGYLFQHEETGLTTVVDVQQVEWGFEKNNPRHQKIGPVYTTPPAAQPATEESSATQPVQEPWKYRRWDDAKEQWELTDDSGWPSEPVYTTPPAQEFVCSTGLCHYKPAAQPAQKRHVSYVCPQCHWSLEKQPAPVQEPVAVTYKEVANAMNALWSGTLEQVQIAMEMADKRLYTTPPKRAFVGLTDDDVSDLCGEASSFGTSSWVRHIEAKLKEKNT
jgi:hypothetical protein